MVTSRGGAPTSGTGSAGPGRDRPRARLMRTLSPVRVGYSRNDSQSPGGRSATKDVACWLNSAARYRSSYTGSLSHGTDVHNCVPSSAATGTSRSSAAAGLAKPTRPYRSSEHSPYGRRPTIRTASSEPSVPGAPPTTGAASRSGSGCTGTLAAAARSNRTARRRQAAVSWSRSRSDSPGERVPGQVRKTAPYTVESVATGSATSANG